MRTAPRLLAAVILLIATPALAVDNTTHVIGLGGYTAFSGIGIQPQLSAKFALKPRIELSLLFGMGIAKSESTFSPGIEFAYILIPEKNMNLYADLAVDADLRTTTGFNSLAYRLGPGIEFFFSELPNLGFMVEFGLLGAFAAHNAESVQTSLSTAVTAFGGAGLHYYF